MYGLKSWAVVAYTYAAEVYCRGCMREAAAFELAGPGEAAFMGRASDGDDVEGFLDRWAARDGVNRGVEWSFDSDDFPKVVFADQVGDRETCGGCFGEIL